MNKSHRKPICVLLLTVIMVIAMNVGVFSLLGNLGALRADSGVTVDLRSQSNSAQVGEVVSVDVVFSSFPEITRFGPIEVMFDTSAMEFVALESGPNLPSDFLFESLLDMEAGRLTISAVNEVAEEQVLTQQTEGENTSTEQQARSISPFFSTNNEITICTITFRITDTAMGEAKAWLGNLSGFRDTGLQTVVAGAGTGAQVTVQSQVSSDATLSDLSIGGVTLTPEFDPGIFQYTAVVSRNTTDVAVTAQTFNLNATTTISGQSGLQIGENTISVLVTAQDGTSMRTYQITVIRDDNLVPEGANLLDNYGNHFYFQDLPDSLVIPSSFYQTTRVLNNIEVPVFSCEGITSVLVYASRNQDGEAMLYLYNPNTQVIREYEPGSTIFRSSVILTVAKLPSIVAIPQGYEATEITYRSMKIPGYVSEDGKVKIAYLQNEDGVAQFYEIDEKSGEVFPFRESDDTNNFFMYLFIVFAGIALVEGILIAILVYRARFRFRHAAKPRRV